MSAIVAGCTYPDADNFNPAATDDDGSCEITGTSLVRRTSTVMVPRLWVTCSSCSVPSARLASDFHLHMTWERRPVGAFLLRGQTGRGARERVVVGAP